jgi:hypothetical protein
VLVNTASPQGSTGITTNVFPAMTLGCGAIAGNITSDNVGPQHLINIKRIAYVARKASEAFMVPAETLTAAPIAAPVQTAAPAATSAPVASPAKWPAGIERQNVAAAVEQYLASKGISLSTPGAASSGVSAALPPLSNKSAASPPPSSTIVSGSAIASVVDRFFAARSTAPRPVAPACGCGTNPQPAANKPEAPAACGCKTPPAVQQAAPPAPAPVTPEPAIPKAPSEPAVDFVCEDDVRRAMNAGRKIRLAAKAILTPSARDLGERNDVFLR